jgi:hypothetical protein
MKHSELHDKIKVFEVAGIPTSGFDYAIPQFYFDQLVGMGFAHPSAWFVSDCASVTLPIVRHVGEAVYRFLEKRSEENTTVFTSYMDQSCKDGASAGDLLLWEFLCHRNNEEVDAGFDSLTAITEAWTDGFSKGRKTMADDLENAHTNLYDLVSDDRVANAAGSAIGHDFGLKKSIEHTDRWYTENGTFTNIGLARRAIRMISEAINLAREEVKAGA